MPGSVTLIKMIGASATRDQIDLCSRILRMAGYDPQNLVVPVGGAYNDEFVMLLQTLGYIGARKTDEYGDFRMTDLRTAPREIWGGYWDIQRKFGRLENQLPNVHSQNVDASLESCADMAVYCVRLIQILERLREKGML